MDYEFDPSLGLLAVDAEGVVGMAQCWKSAFVKDLAVHPRARRRGVGRALMLAVFHEFAGRGATHVDLRTREENSNAQAFYRSLGMTLVSRDPG
jgi:ribosomal protein S18 acetylase RimI-like enzyme